MAKNELLSFADGEDANVLPTAQWEALTDILENGFQSGIAKSEQVNRVLAQGAVASYVLGQLIVDQLNEDATLDKDTLYQNIVKALQENAKDVCLPSSGGTMTGNIHFNGNYSITTQSSANQFSIYHGNSASQGAGIWLYGNDNQGKGKARIQVYDKANSKYRVFDIRPDGAVVWDGKDVITSAGGTFTGDVTLTDTKVIKNTVDTGWTRLYGGTSMQGSRIQLAGKDNPNYEGVIWLVARDTDNSLESILKLTPNGSITWGSKDVDVVDAKTLERNGYIKYKNGLVLIWGVDQGTAQSRTINKLVSCSTLVAMPFDALYSDTTPKYITWRADLTTTTTETFKCVDGNTGAMGYFIIGKV